MKFFIVGGFILGAIVTLVGIFLFADKIDYIANGIKTPGKVIDFEVDTVYEKKGKFQGITRTVYYPIVEYSFQGHRYEHVHREKQFDQMRPFSNSQGVTLLCSAKQPNKPFVGTVYQLVMTKMFVAVAGLAVMLVCGVMWIIAWLRGDLEDRPVSYVNQARY
ncbi:MAG: hypothetical protein QM703_12245 [Gemmatales bacterium]